MRIEAGARTDTGRVRQNNEDSYHMELASSLFVLCDGMGGHGHGEVASAMAVSLITEYCLATKNGHRAEPAAGAPLSAVSNTLTDTPRAGATPRASCLVQAITAANKKVYKSAAEKPEMRGMGTTVVAAWIDGQRLNLAHVGDSRAYLLRAGTLEQLTNDHSLVAEQVRQGVLTPQEAESSNLQCVLTRAIGTADEVEVDSDEQLLLNADTLLLCSDGLTRMLTDPEIASTLITVRGAQDAANELVEQANDRGGEDNVTVIVLRFARGLMDRLRFAS